MTFYVWNKTQIIFKYFEIGKKNTLARQILLVWVLKESWSICFSFHLQLAEKNIVLQDFDVYYSQKCA